MPGRQDRMCRDALNNAQAVHAEFVAGSGQEIQTPEFLVEYRPDMVIVMNPLYKDEIAHKLAGMGLTPEVVVA